MNADSVAQTNDNGAEDTSSATLQGRLDRLEDKAEALEAEPTAADIRAEGDARHAEFVDGIRRDILAADGIEKVRHQERLIRVLERDVERTVEQRNRAEGERGRAEDREADTRDRERETFEKLIEAWKGWAAQQDRANTLQRKVDRREGINWPVVYALVVAVIFGVYMVASVIVGGA